MVKKLFEKRRRRSRKHLLSAAMIRKHLKKSTRLLNGLKDPGHRFLMFSDEKIFTVDPVCNKHNDRGVTFENDPLNIAEYQQPSIQLNIYNALRRALERGETTLTVSSG